MCVYNTAAKHLYSTRQNWAQARWLNGQYSVVSIGIYIQALSTLFDDMGHGYVYFSFVSIGSLYLRIISVKYM